MDPDQVIHFDMGPGPAINFFTDPDPQLWYIDILSPVTSIIHTPHGKEIYTFIYKHNCQSKCIVRNLYLKGTVYENSEKINFH